MIETVNHSGNSYPAFTTRGNAAKYIMEFAKEVVKGDVIYDIGYGKDEWKFPGAMGIDLKDGNTYDAMHLPPLQADAIFNSHLFEHLERPYEALDFWHSKLKVSGILFMYLPNMDTQSYHRCWSNRKHLHYVSPHIMRLYFEDNKDKWTNVFISQGDAYDAFTVFCNKK